ncbi:MAG: hypothetical protein AB7G80_04690 [Dongiaceae bacterium]
MKLQQFLKSHPHFMEDIKTQTGIGRTQGVKDIALREYNNQLFLNVTVEPGMAKPVREAHAKTLRGLMPRFIQARFIEGR